MDIQLKPKKGLRRKHVPWLVGGVLLAALIGWILFGTHRSVLKVDRRTLNITEVRKARFDDFVRIEGQVAPISVVQVSPEEGGIVTEKVVEEGAKVRAGDVLVRLTNSNLDLQILNAEAELAEKQNLLRNTQVTMQQDKLNNEMEKLQLEQDLQRRERTFNQYRRLYDEALISREEFVQASEDYELARRKHRLINERLLQDSIYRTIQMEQMEDNLANMQRNLTLIRERKNRLEVRSKIDGELGQLDVELGASIASGQKIGQVNDLSDFKIEAQIDEHYIDRVRTGLEGTFGRDGKTYRLSLRKVFPEVRDGRFRTELVFTDERPRQIRSGQSYYIDLQLGQPQDCVLIPKGTFYQVTGGEWIFVLNAEGDKAYRRHIRIGRQNPLYYEVTEGLEPGERVIISGYESYKASDELDIY